MFGGHWHFKILPSPDNDGKVLSFWPFSRGPFAEAISNEPLGRDAGVAKELPR